MTGSDLKIVVNEEGKVDVCTAIDEMRKESRNKGRIEGKVVAVVGDILHSRVARSQIHALNTLGAAEVRVIGPRTLLPRDIGGLGCKVFYKLEDGLKDCDVVIMLRLQKERM